MKWRDCNVIRFLYRSASCVFGTHVFRVVRDDCRSTNTQTHTHTHSLSHKNVWNYDLKYTCFLFSCDVARMLLDFRYILASTPLFVCIDAKFVTLPDRINHAIYVNFLTTLHKSIIYTNGFCELRIAVFFPCQIYSK